MVYPGGRLWAIVWVITRKGARQALGLRWMTSSFVKMSHETLTHRIRKYANIATDAHQVAKRLHQLISVRLNQYRSGYLLENKASKARRLALVDPRYQAVIEEYIKISGYAMEARMRWETHLMLLEARRSLQSFRRAQKRG